MDDRAFILSLAKQRIEREITKSDRKVEKASEKLRTVDFEHTSLRSRANMRISLNVACEERQAWIRRYEELEKWREEVGHGKTRDSGTATQYE